MPLFNIYNDLIDEIIAQLKTIPELATNGSDVRVFKWKTALNPIQGRHEAIVVAGQMEPVGGYTTKSSKNDFEILIDLFYYGSDIENSFKNALSVAEKIYDKFHLTNINNKVGLARVSLIPGDSQLQQRGLLTTPIRIVVRCEKIITQ